MCRADEAQNYGAAASFVPKLATTVYRYLDPQPTDHILDIGCGDGQLTVDIAAVTPEGRVLGLDASAQMIQAATELAATRNVTKCSFQVADCSTISSQTHGSILDGSWDKVFSNAALHWIMKKPESRKSVILAAHAALKQGGKFVFESGGSGNVAEVVTAALSGLVAQGIDIDKARDMIPWFFPSEAWMAAALQEVGFDVEKIELEYRPTKMNPPQSGGGLAGWPKFFCATFLEGVENSDAVVDHMCSLLKTSVTREDGTEWLGYVRLRAVAVKK
jgi:SAM-dependent methyltransferase